jgi:hypothetical protein
MSTQAAQIMYDYVCYGIGIKSQIELPELEPIGRASLTDTCPIVIELGPVPSEIKNAQTTLEGFMVGEGEALYTVRGIGGFHIIEGDKIVISAAPDHDPSWLRFILISMVLGALLHQRGVYPLHASSVMMPHGCVGFAGLSGAGKSTLASYLSSRGYEVIGDDQMVITNEAENWLAWPGPPLLHLFPESAQHSRLEPAAANSQSPRAGKSIYRCSSRFTKQQHKLRALYFLDWAEGEPSIAPISGLEGFIQLRPSISANGLLTAMGAEAEFLAWSSRLLASVPAFKFSRPRNFDQLSSGVDLLTQHWASQDVLG